MEDHHWGGQGWNLAVEPQEEFYTEPVKKVFDKHCIIFTLTAIFKQMEA
jgi:hypothetical protein